MTSSPPSRSPPPPPPDPSLSSEPLSGDPAQLTPELEDDIDLSTLRWITGSLRHTWLPYLGWAIAFVSFAKLLRFASPYLFRATRWTADWACWAVEKLVQFLAWSCMWLGIVAVVLWLVLGAVLGLAWLGLKAKPVMRRNVVGSSSLKRYGAQAVVGVIVWILGRRLLGAKIGNTLLIVFGGWQGWTKYRQTVPASRAKTTTPSQPEPPRGASDDPKGDDGETEDPEDAEDQEKAEQWARAVRQEMLRDSLLRRGKTSGTPGGEADDREPGEEVD
ncbi:hypothetical protein JCM11491_001266 [Sporobolomyces phaffii]